jgi:tight adherence protein C
MELILLVGGLASLAMAIALTVSVLARAESEPSGVAGGIESIEKVYTSQSRSTRAPYGQGGMLAPMMRRMRNVAERLSPSGSVTRLQGRLDVAGNPGNWTPERVLAYKGLGLFSAGIVFSIAGLTSGLVSTLVFGMVGAIIGFFLPELLVYNAGVRRQDAITKTLPDVLDLLCVSVEAGLGFDAALSRVARNATGPLAGELARVLQEMQIGKSREEALKALSGRTSVAELRTFVAALVQASDLGIPIGNVLREQAKEMRIKRRQRAEEIAQKLPVKITFPVIICILPALFIVVIGPGVLSLMQTLGKR